MNKNLQRNIFRGCGISVIFLVLFFYAGIYASAMPDDSFITLTFAKNLIRNGSWGFFHGETINTSTSPLNTAALAIALLAFSHPILAVSVYTAGLWTLSCLLLFRIGIVASPNPKLFVLAVMVGLLTNPFLLSTTGLESWLSITLFLAALACFLNGKWVLLGLSFGFLALARIDNAVLPILALFFIPGIKNKIKMCAGSFAVAAPWYLFSWIALGSLLPETLFIKAAQKTFDGNGFYNGIGMYFRHDPPAAASSFVYALFLPLLIKYHEIFQRPLIPFLLLYAIIHYCAYSALRVPPYYWYYTPQIISIILLGSLCIAAAGASARRWGIGLLVLPITLFSGVLWRNALPLESPLVKTNWATHREYRQIGQWLKENTPEDREIQIMWELGTVSFYSERRLCNPFSSRSDLFELIENTLKPKGARRRLIQFNYYFLNRIPSPKNREFKLMYFSPADVLPPEILMRWPVVNSWRGEGAFVYFREAAD